MDASTDSSRPTHIETDRMVRAETVTESARQESEWAAWNDIVVDESQAAVIAMRLIRIVAAERTEVIPIHIR